MSERIKRLLNAEKSKLSQNTPTNIGIELKGNMKPFTDPNAINILSQEDIFNQEREDSKKYRIYGNVRLITTNELSNANIFDWDFLFDGDPSLTPNNWLIQVLTPIKNHYSIGINSRIGGSVVTTEASQGVTTVTQFKTPNNKLGITTFMPHKLDVGDYFYLCGVNSDDTLNRGIHQVESLGNNDGDDLDKNIVTTTNIGEDGEISINTGIIKKIINPTEADIEYENPLTATNNVATNIDGVFYSLITSTNHGLNSGDFIEVRSGDIGYFNGLFKIKVIDTNTFVIESKKASQTLSNTTFRRLEGTPSEYYVRKFGVISTNDYETFETAFANTIYPNTLTNKLGVANKVYSFQYNKDINIGDILSNRNGKPTQMYLGFIKRSGQNTHDWSNVTSDWFENFENTQDDNFKLETISQRVPNGVGTIEKINYGDEYFGDFVEFNRLTLEETTISEAIHRFTPNGNTTNGYYFKPFKKLQIRVYSDNIEEAASGDVILNLPSDTITYPDGTRVWKDILSIGYYEGSNGVDYPFLNNSHYYYSNNILYLRVQKPNRPLLSQERIKIGDVTC